MMMAYVLAVDQLDNHEVSTESQLQHQHSHLQLVMSPFHLHKLLHWSTKTKQETYHLLHRLNLALDDEMTQVHSRSSSMALVNH